MPIMALSSTSQPFFQFYCFPYCLKQSLIRCFSFIIHRHRIRVFLNRETYASYVKYLYRQAHTFMEESGANVLYLAVGFLKWRQKDETADRYAPLVLMPVSLERGRADTDYTLTIRDSAKSGTKDSLI